MKILRKAAGRVVLGYGAESLEQEKGGHFSLELVQATQETKSSSKLKIELTLPVCRQTLKSLGQHPDKFIHKFRRADFEIFSQARTNLIIDIQDAGGDLLPAWFGTTGMADACRMLASSRPAHFSFLIPRRRIHRCGIAKWLLG